jgi:hypothetical protein
MPTYKLNKMLKTSVPTKPNKVISAYSVSKKIYTESQG